MKWWFREFLGFYGGLSLNKPEVATKEFLVNIFTESN